jgi:hypothetical protein
VEKQLELFVKKNKKEPVDFIIINGDLVGHGYSVKPNKISKISAEKEEIIHRKLQLSHKKV